MSGTATRPVAAFDFDGTLSQRDTLVPFLAQVAGPRRFSSVCARLGVAGARRRVDLLARDDVKAEMARLIFAGRSEDEIRSRADRYAQALFASRLRPFMIQRVRDHVAAGHETLLVSASLTYYLEPIADRLDMSGVIAVELAIDGGRFTGELARPNVRAAEKVVRLDQWLSGRSDVAPRELWSYGNSSGDFALLDAADHGYWLGRSSKAPAGTEVLTAASPRL